MSKNIVTERWAVVCDDEKWKFSSRQNFKSKKDLLFLKTPGREYFDTMKLCKSLGE